ncbi:MAG TPA: hypothetical protein VJ483_05485 [Holophagaceae bacterium]|nr:hypothetical protein [Holophagaceae bacterium]
MPSHGYVCPECGEFAGSTRDEISALDRAAIQQRSMWPEVSTILTYPLVDFPSFVVLSIFLGVIGFIPTIGWLIAQCVLLGYGFQAISKVGAGDLGEFRPTSSNIDELAQPLLLALCAAIISQGPLIAAGVYLLPATITDVLTKGTAPVGALLAIAALTWSIIYMPAALVVAGQSRSWQATLNPLHGIHVMAQMGTVYWQALLIFLVIYLANGVVSLLVHALRIPILGSFALAFIASYAYLCIGCALGFAVFKRAPDLA